MPGRGSAPHPDAAGAIGTVRRIGSAVADGCLIAAEQLVDASGFNRPKVPFGNRRFATGTIACPEFQSQFPCLPYCTT